MNTGNRKRLISTSNVKREMNYQIKMLMALKSDQTHKKSNKSQHQIHNYGNKHQNCPNNTPASADLEEETFQT